MSDHAFLNRIAARNSRFALASLLTVFALVLAACAPASPGPAAPAAASTEVLGTTQQPSAGGATGPATVMVSSNDKLGKFLVDAKGMTLYLFTKDTKNTSNCYDKCAQSWPPLLTQGAPVASTGADSSMLGVTTRKDGSQQVTYNGLPLYYYAPDKQPGDTNGQGVGGVWFVVPPSGQAPSAGSGASATPAAQPTASSAGAGAAMGPATVMVSDNDKLGKYLVDAKGMTLYLFTKDTKNTSNCYDKCAQAWPPLLTQGAPVADSGADSSMLGVTTRKDGSQQVTYNGWPLYYYAPDKQPGDTTGQGVGNVWFVVPPSGQAPSGGGAAPQAAAASASSAAANGGYAAP